MTQLPCLAYVCTGKACHRGIEREGKKLVIPENGLVFPELMDMKPKFAFGNLNDRGPYETLSASFDQKYALFDALRREVFADTVHSYPSP